MKTKRGNIENKKHFKFKWDDKVILIADDLKINFILLKSMLNETHANLLWAQNGRQAVEACSVEKKPDIVLMDYNMPVMNGFEATKKIKAIKNNLPVISHSSCPVGTPEFENISTTCDDYVLKPIAKNLLLNKINKYLDNSQLHS